MPALGLGKGEDFRLYIATGGKKVPLPETLRQEEMKVGLERSIVSGSTLTMEMRDPERVLQKEGYFTRSVGKYGGNRSDILFDKLWFRASHFAKTADQYTLTFEDREVSMARDYKHPFKMSAGGHHNPTAAFMRYLFHKAVPHCVFYCPEFDKQIAILPHQETEKQREKHKKPGIPKKLETRSGQVVAEGPATGGSHHTGSVDLHIEGVPLDAEQKKMAEILIGVCNKKNAPGICKIAIICAAIGESNLHNLVVPNSLGYWGVLQGGSGKGKSAPNFTRTPNDQTAEEMATSFLDGGRGFQSGGAIHLSSKSSDPGFIATEVEKSGEPPDYYGKHKAEAERIVNVLGGSTGEVSSGGTEGSYTPQRFLTMPVNERSEGEEAEGSWECALNYAEKIRWRLFCTGGQFNFMSDIYLEHAKAKMEIDYDTVGITDIKWEIDTREKKNPPTLTVEARAPIWAAGPGSAVVMGLKSGKELHEGIWIVSVISRPDVTDDAVTITLERPRAPLAERELAQIKRKIAQTVVNKGEPGAEPKPGGEEHNEGHNAGTAGPASQAAEQVLFNCEWIAKQHIPYVYSGGHGATFGPTPGDAEHGFTRELHESFQSGLDCSSAVSWALSGGHANILPGSHPYTTKGLEFWGAPGPGAFFTVWVINSAKEEHTYIEFHFPGQPKKIWEGKGKGTIVGFFPYFPPASGFKARHWPGS